MLWMFELSGPCLHELLRWKHLYSRILLNPNDSVIQKMAGNGGLQLNMGLKPTVGVGAACFLSIHRIQAFLISYSVEIICALSLQVAMAVSACTLIPRNHSLMIPYPECLFMLLVLAALVGRIQKPVSFTPQVEVESSFVNSTNQSWQQHFYPHTQFPLLTPPLNHPQCVNP